VKGIIDVAGLRTAEHLAQSYARAVDIGMTIIVDDWRFGLLFFEYDGDGSTWCIHPSTERAEFIRAMRAQSDRLIRLVSAGFEGASTNIVPAAGSPRGLSGEQIKNMAALGKGFHAEVKRELPDGWGYALLMWDPEGLAHFYTSSGQREDMGTALAELAGILEAEGDVPPGVLGSER
jgi:hypothetical protein